MNTTTASSPAAPAPPHAAKMIFLNLPVRDVAASARFYEAIGCTKNPQFSNDQAVSMVWSETITFMLLTHAFFSTFATKPIADAGATTEVLICLSFQSRADVDKVTEAAAAAGGRADVRAKQDMGFMYGRSFEDPDGHVFEPMWMDVTQMPAQVAAGT